MRFKLPFLTHPEHGEVVARGFLEDGLHWTGGFHDDQSCTSSCRFGEFLGEHTLGFLFDTRLWPPGPDHVQDGHLGSEAAG
jgi:hypothetical protein